jgi:hypothetical protein
MPTSRARVALLLCLVAVAACHDEFQSGVTRCSPDNGCPPNFTCKSGLCYSGIAPEIPDGSGGSAAGGQGGQAGSGSGGGAGGVAGMSGGPDAAQSDAPAPTPADCARFATAWCKKKLACESLDSDFKSETECRASLELYCKTFLADQPDSAWTPATAGVCVAELELPGCFSWFGLDSSRACDPRGKRPGGSGAFSWVQCQSAASFWRGGACGYCYEAAAAGQPCGNHAVCPTGHLCSNAGNCRPASLNGQPCGNDSPCHSALVCAAGVCVPRGLVDAGCRSDNDCDGTLGLRCHVATGRCARTKAGMSWNRGNPDGSIDTCAPGTSYQANGSCVAYATAGQACARTDDGPHCQLPLECIGGKCVAPKVVDCPAVRPPAGYPAGADPWCFADRPLYCPALGGLDWGCWPANTACSTVTQCGDQPKSCASAAQAFDCATQTCIESPCKKPEFPQYCSASGDVPGSCWEKDTRCSTVTLCGDQGISCNADRSVPDCALQKCVPACTVPTAATTCNQCAARKCCGSYAGCQGDPMCKNKAGANWTALSDCAAKFCATACTATDPLAPPPPR